MILSLASCSGGRGARAADAAPTSTSAAAKPTSTATPAQAQPTRVDTAGNAKILPFAADTKPDLSTEREGSPLLVSIVEEVHDGYVRYVFTFAHDDAEGHQPWRSVARPAWDVRYVPPDEVVMDGSGEPLRIGGVAHLKMRFQAARHYQDGRDSLDRFPDEGDLAFAGEFEGQVVWFLGAVTERPFRVEYGGDGRVLVDVVR